MSVSGSPTTGEMLHASETAAAAAATAAVSKEAPPAPIIPASAAEASARLEAVKSDPKWRDALLSGSKAHAKELSDLQAVVDKEKNVGVEMAVAGELFPGIQPSGHLAAVGTAQHLRNAGFSDDEVRHVISGGSVSAQEHAAAVATKASLMNDLDFSAKYLAGDGPSKATMLRLNSIISSSIKSAA